MASKDKPVAYSLSNSQYADRIVRISIETILGITSAISGEVSLAELEESCKKVLLENGQKAFVSAYEANKTSKKITDDKNMLDTIKDKAKTLKDKTTNSLNDNIINALSPAQIKNNAIRFSTEDTSASHKNSLFLKLTDLIGKTGDSRDYEDVTAPEILNAPICDICIIESGDPVPEGFYRIYKSPSNKKANLNSSNSGHTLYLCIKKDLTGKAIPITSLLTFFPSMQEFLPLGFAPVRKGKYPCNLNSGNDPEKMTRIFLAFKKEKSGNPITDIQILFPEKGEDTPRGFNTITRSPGGRVADLNTGTNGWKTFISYKQTAMKLSTLTRSAEEVKKILDQLASDEANLKAGTTTAIAKQSQSTLGSELGSRPTSVQKQQPKSPMPQPSSPAPSPLASSSKVGGGNHAASILSPPNSPNLSSSEPSKEIVIDTNDDIDDMANGTIGDDINDYNYNQAILLNTDGSEISSKIKKIIHVLLSALYIRHDSIPGLALSGLSKLLKETTLFENDFNNMTPKPHYLTLLDLTVSVICERFDMCIENDFNDLLNFIRTLVHYSNGLLSIVILQKLYRIISYLFTYFSTRPAWNLQCLDIPMNIETGDQLSVLTVLKELIWTVEAQIEKFDVLHFLSRPKNESSAVTFDKFAGLGYKEESFILVKDLVDDFVDGVIESVELANITESTILLMNKESVSVYQNRYWQDIGLKSKLLFTNNSYRILFITLCAICKTAWQPLKNNSKNNGLKDSDFGVKLLALEALTYFLDGAGEKMAHSKIMGYLVRRIIVPCIMFNIKSAFLDHRIFKKLLTLMSALWKNWRVHIRIEFAVLCEILVIRVLQASRFCLRPIYQNVVLHEVVQWFQQPYLLTEMYMNYDMDSKFVSNWNIFSLLIRELCLLARKTSLTSKIVDHRFSYISAGNAVSNKITNRDNHLNAILNVTKIAKTLMDAAGWDLLGENAIKNIVPSSESSLSDSRRLSMSKSYSEFNDLSYNSIADENSHEAQLKNTSNTKIRNEELVNHAISIYKEKNSIKKAISFLVEKGYMQDQPSEIALFLRVCKSSLDPTAIGDYFGEGGHPEKVDEIEYFNQIRFRYIRAVSFMEQEVDVALRLFLTGCGFRLPGESQKIDRLIEAFAKIWWQDNNGSEYCPFYSPDSIHILCFAIIMLNTDLHKANDAQGKHKKRKMTVEQFIQNLRGINNNQNINPAYLTKIYENIASNQIALKFDASEKQAQEISQGPKAKKSALLTTLSAIPQILLSFNKHGEEKTSESQFIEETIKYSNEAHDLLRSVAPFSYRYQINGIDINITHDLVKLMYENIWFHFYAIVESLRDNIRKVDFSIVFCALDILGYSLTTCIFLGMNEIKAQFANMLKDYREEYEPAGRHYGRQLVDDSWFEDAMHPGSNMFETAAKIYKLIVHLKDSIMQSENHELTRLVAAQIEKKAKVLDNNSFFIKEGDLMKRDRSGRLTSYRFFLFSDEMLYCHLDKSSGEYKVHGQFQLVSLTVSDIDSDTSGCSFYINHPIKSFVVVAPDSDSKNSWINDLRQAASVCTKREMADTVGPLHRRMSIISRIESQKTYEIKLRETEKSLGTSSTTPERPTKGANNLNRSDIVGSISPLKLNYESSSNSVVINSSEIEAELITSLPSSKPAESSSVILPVKEAPMAATETAPISNSAAASAAKERALNRDLLKKEAIAGLTSALETADERQLNSIFDAGVQFWKGMNAPEPAKSILINAFNECKKEGYSSISPKNSDKNEGLGAEKSSENALAARKKDFLIHLVTYFSYWKYDQFL